MENEKIIKLLTSSKYYSSEDLRYNKNYGFLFSKEQLADFLNSKDRLIEEENELFRKLPLKTFNSKHCFYVEGCYLLGLVKDYYASAVEDMKQNQSFITSRSIDDILMSRIFSEIEGTLNIENVQTTRKKIKEIYNAENLKDKNDTIIKNMIDAIKYIIIEKPPFNKDNLRKLYDILSHNCLDEEDKLPKNCYYRNDTVSVGGFDGAPIERIDELMDSLFEFANNPSNIKLHDDMFPHICHYYILYVHPYFDYNGRTARMVSFWLSYINGLDFAPFFISEAINEDKVDYYKAIINTRVMNNDLTYFLGYIMESSIKFCLIYKNLEEIKKILSSRGDFLSQTELNYVKKILIHNETAYFNYKMFLEYINGKMTKQGALKILDKFADYDILTKSQNKKGENIYKLNDKLTVYRYLKN